jgi:hypothetical protein
MARLTLIGRLYLGTGLLGLATQGVLWAARQAEPRQAGSAQLAYQPTLPPAVPPAAGALAVAVGITLVLVAGRRLTRQRQVTVRAPVQPPAYSRPRPARTAARPWARADL